MVKIIKYPEQTSEFVSYVAKSRASGIEFLTRDVASTVQEIFKDVINNGDTALVKYTEKFDGWKIGDAKNLKVSAKEIAEAKKQCKPGAVEALKTAAKRIEEYHLKQIPQDERYSDYHGNDLGWQWTPIQRVGIYVPGGKAAYPSSVLMNAMPAQVAGVERIVMVVPAPKGVLNPLVLAAAEIAGIKEIYKIGGAQAIAALACGTKTIEGVDKIVGPGNAYVAEAKRQVFGLVGIDMIAGPSEILVIADNDCNPEWIAADLLSQAEHDEQARSILVTDSEEVAEEVEKAVEKQLSKLEREDIARKSWEANGLIILVKSIDEAIEVANIVAPEHLELCFQGAEAYVEKVKNAGAIFVGRYTPEAIGDYIAGPSHVLPTSGSARFSSGLSVYDFLKRTSIISCSEEGFRELSDATELLATEEGLGAHAKSISVRKKN